MDFVFFECSVNEGFLGGEKKCNEILQMVLLEFVVVILDEIDFGLDIDVLCIVVGGVNQLVMEDNVMLFIIYYQCFFDEIILDYVYVMVVGWILCIGGWELVFELEQIGYDWVDQELVV